MQPGPFLNASRLKAWLTCLVAFNVGRSKTNRESGEGRGRTLAELGESCLTAPGDTNQHQTDGRRLESSHATKETSTATLVPAFQGTEDLY
jgi:hypothetical protein